MYNRAGLQEEDTELEAPRHAVPGMSWLECARVMTAVPSE